MGYKVDNAVIMVAGVSSRFAPVSYEKPKSLIEVRGEILIERQIRQLQEKGISNIILVTGYKSEQFLYLKKKFGLIIIENREYAVRNNHASIYAVREYLRNTYICSGDNYFSINPFEAEVGEAYYAALFASGKTDEWCLQTDENDFITGVRVGGENSWYMMGHVFWNETFSRKFVQILKEEYEKPETEGKLWEDIYRENLQQLKLKIRRYGNNEIFEFDSLDELRLFDDRYKIISGSAIMQKLASMLHCPEGELTGLKPVKGNGENVIGVTLVYDGNKYQYLYEKEQLTLMR